MQWVRRVELGVIDRSGRRFLGWRSGSPDIEDVMYRYWADDQISEARTGLLVSDVCSNGFDRPPLVEEPLAGIRRKVMEEWPTIHPPSPEAFKSWASVTVLLEVLHQHQIGPSVGELGVQQMSTIG
jgi:hypothetical protein